MLSQYLRQNASVRRAVSAAAVPMLVGCGPGPLHDDATGHLDLVPFFRASATAADPNSSLPTNIAPTRGWVSGKRVEYYDFGTAGVPRKLGTRGETLRIPDAASVAPMYFFYDAGGRPLFSKPSHDARSNTWYMRGGKNVLEENPVGAPASGSERDQYFSTSYLVRPRALLHDSERGSPDYQRPVINRILDDPNYDGLWEIVEITVLERDYEPDDIKSAETVKDGLASGRLSQVRTGKVINCPVLDERTLVTPSALFNNIPRPRIEVWYRTKLGNCFLVNGWETIGETLNEDLPATDRENLQLFRAADRDRRVDTFDVLSSSIGQDVALSVPVAKLYVPTVSIPIGNQLMDRPSIRYVGDDLSVAAPRHRNDDPSGYSPIVWLWDLLVPQDPPYQPGTYQDLGNVDPGAVAARDAGTTVWTRNYAIIGTANSCKSNADCKWGQQCNPMPDYNIATTDPPPGMNIADVVIAREGGPRCDVPVTTFGGFCAAGVSRCDVQGASGGETEKNLKALGVAVAGPVFAVHADLKAAQTTLDNTVSLSNGVDPKDPTRTVTADEIASAQAAIAGQQSTVDALTAKVAYYDGRGFTTDFSGYGYGCYPPTGNGYCQIRCDSTQSSTNVTVPTQLEVQDPLVPGRTNQVSYTFNTEVRCGGLNMLGYRCLPSSTLPERQRLCMRECTVSDPPPKQRAVCGFPLNLKADVNGNSSTAFVLGEGIPAKDALPNQICTSNSIAGTGVNPTTVQVCSWNLEFEPRDPNVWPGQ